MHARLQDGATIFPNPCYFINHISDCDVLSVTNTIVAGRPYPIVAGRPHPLWATLHCRGPDGVPVYIAQYDVYYFGIRKYMRTVGGVIYIYIYIEPTINVLPQRY